MTRRSRTPDRLTQLGAGSSQGPDFSALRDVESPPRSSAESKPIQQAQILILEGYPSQNQQATLGPNRGTRRWGVAEMRAAVQADTATAARAQGIVPVLPPVHVTFTYVVPDRTRRDWDNYALIAKPCQDGLVRAGILPGGDHFEVLTARVAFRVERGRRALEIELRSE